MVKQRCSICKKRIKSILPISCKCKKFFCNLHKYPNHDCNFDYVEQHQNNLKKYVIKVVPEKYDTI